VKYALWGAGGLLVLFLIAGGNGDGGKAVADCQARGEVYFREIGSWPKLKNGDDASSTARSRCLNTTTAF